MKASLLIALAIFFSLFSCKKDKTPNEYNPNSPSFRVGSKWVYHNSFFDPNGVINYEFDETYQIEKDTVINGVKYYEFMPNFYFANKPDGFYEFNKLSNIEELIYKVNVSNFDTYTGSFLNTSQTSSCATGFNAYVTNIDTAYTYNTKQYEKLISVTFNTYPLSCQFRPSYQNDLFSKKIGLMVQRIYHDGNSPAVLQKINLKSFTY